MHNWLQKARDMDADPCEICGLDTEAISPTTGDLIRQKCPRCGEFGVSGTAVSLLRTPRSDSQTALISGWVRERSSRGQNVLLRSEHLKQIFETAPPKISERADRLLRFVVDKQSVLGDTVNVHVPEAYAATFSQGRNEIGVLVNVLKDKGLLEYSAMGGDVKVLPNGYLEAENLSIPLWGPKLNLETPIDGGQTTFDRVASDEGNAIATRRKTAGTVPWSGRPTGSHVCTSSIGIGLGQVGLTVHFVPYPGNFGRTPETIHHLLGWESAINLGEGEEGLTLFLRELKSQLLDVLVPEVGLDEFLNQLTTENWITMSESPLHSGPLPSDNSGVNRHPNNPKVWTISRPMGILVVCISFGFGNLGSEAVVAFSNGVLEALGQPRVEEIFHRAGKEATEASIEVFENAVRKIPEAISIGEETVLNILGHDEPDEGRPEEPTTAIRPEGDET